MALPRLIASQGLTSHINPFDCGVTLPSWPLPVNCFLDTCWLELSSAFFGDSPQPGSCPPPSSPASASSLSPPIYAFLPPSPALPPGHHLLHLTPGFCIVNPFGGPFSCLPRSMTSVARGSAGTRNLQLRLTQDLVPYGCSLVPIYYSARQALLLAVWFGQA